MAGRGGVVPAHKRGRTLEEGDDAFRKRLVFFSPCGVGHIGTDSVVKIVSLDRLHASPVKTGGDDSSCQGVTGIN